MRAFHGRSAACFRITRVEPPIAVWLASLAGLVTGFLKTLEMHPFSRRVVMFSFRRLVLLAAAVLALFATAPADVMARSSISEADSLAARGRRYGPYSTSSAAWAKARQLQRQG